MISVLMYCVDNDGLQVRLTEGRWFGHILGRHPELAECEQVVRRVVIDPEQINQDRDQPRRKCFYRKVLIPIAATEGYLKVVVQYEANAHDEVEGWIITAFPIDSIPKDEEQLWPSAR